MRVRDEYLGKEVWCPSCKAPLTLQGERVPNHEVFVSYSNKDKAVADAICATLEEKKIRCWVAPRDISAGNSWGGSIIEAIEDAQVMVLVYSGHSNLSPQIIREVERAVAKGLLIVPFRIEAAPMSKDMEYFLSSSHWFDALTPPLEQHLAQFAEMVRLILFKNAKAKEATPSTERTPTEKPRTNTLPWKGAAAALLVTTLALGVVVWTWQHQQQKDVVTPAPTQLVGAAISTAQPWTNSLGMKFPAVPPPKPVETPKVQVRETASEAPVVPSAVSSPTGSTLSVAEAERLAASADRISEHEWSDLKGSVVIVLAAAKQKTATGVEIKKGERYLLLPCAADRWSSSSKRWPDVDFRGHTDKPIHASNGAPPSQLCYSIDNGPLFSLVGHYILSKEGRLFLGSSDMLAWAKGMGARNNNRGSVRVKIIPISTGTDLSSSAPTPAVVAPLPAAQPAQMWTNSLGMIFVPVPGTAVQFSIWDTRVQDYQAFVIATGRFWEKPGFEQGPTHPVAGVSWNDAKAFCVWLTDKERRAGILKPHEEYRLPMDLEWSTAVGLKNETGSTPKERDMQIKRVYPWGTQWPPPPGAGNYGKRPMQVDGFEFTSPVGSFAANRLGLYDMGGNVWQWCEDWYDDTCTEHVMRGGSWGGTDARFLLSSCRRDFVDRRPERYGFRCVLAGGGVSAPR